MADYSKSTNFAAKDSLTTGDPGKVVRGTEINTEFDNIATAVATKADKASPAFTGTVTTPGLTVSGTLAANGTLQIGGVALTATAAELNYTDGVTSNIQTQLDAKQATLTGAASSIASSNLTASRAVVSDASGKVAASAVTATELGYLSGVTSNLQTQIDNIEAGTGGGTGDVTLDGTQTLTNKTLTEPVLNSPTIGTKFTLGSWEVTVVSNNLVFKYNGTTVFRVATNGAIIAKDNITAFGSP